jgi:hypothetical protein
MCIHDGTIGGYAALPLLLSPGISACAKPTSMHRRPREIHEKDT